MYHVSSIHLFYASLSFFVLGVLLHANYITNTVKERQLNNTCIREPVQMWGIDCSTNGFGTLELYRVKNGTVRIVPNNISYSFSVQGHRMHNFVYDIETVTESEDVYYICHLDLTGHGTLYSKKFHLPAHSRGELISLLMISDHGL